MTLTEIVADLQSPDPALRLNAVERLRRIGGAEAAGALVLLLADPDPTVRNRVVEALVLIGPAATESVQRYLASWHEPLGTIIPELVGRLRLSSTLPLLAQGITDPAPATRAAVALALGRIGGEVAVPPLLELLRDLVDEVRIAAANALGAIAHPAAVNALLDEAADDNPAVRIAAVDALGRIGDRRGIDTIVRLSGDDPNPDVRRRAMAALRQVSVRTVNHLIAAMTRDDIGDRIRAADELLRQGKAAILPLTELLGHANPAVRGAAAELLGSIGDPAAIDGLDRASRDPEWTVRYSAVTALGRIRHARAAEPLAHALQDEDEKVAAAAAAALERLGEAAVNPLFDLLSSRQPLLRVRAIDVLGRLRHRGAWQRLLAGLRDSSTWVRIVSCQALGEIREERAMPALIRALDDRDPVVRAMAAEALGKLRDFRASMPLLGRLKDESLLVQTNVLRALGLIGNPVAEGFLRAQLDRPEPAIRAAAIEALAALGVTRLLPRFRELARPWPFSRVEREVRAAARAAVEILSRLEENERAEPEPPSESDSTRSGVSPDDYLRPTPPDTDDS